MLTISRNSWHYQLAKIGSTYSVPYNLCPYIRAVGIGFVLSLLMITIGVISLGLALWMIVMPFLWYFNGITDSILLREEGFTIWLCFMFMIIVGSIIAFDVPTRMGRGIKKGVTIITDQVPTEVKEASTVKICKEYIKSLHDKICPRIEFKE